MPGRTQWLKKREWKNKDETPIMAFDFETVGLGGEFIIAAFKSSDNVSYLAYTLTDVIDFIIANPNYLYLAHNASGYEFAYLYPKIAELLQQDITLGLECVLQGEHRIVQFTITVGTNKPKRSQKHINIRDTLCLFNTSLANVAKSYCPDIPKGEPPWNKAHDNFDIHSELWINYVFRDCEIILVAYEKFKSIIWDTFGCPIGITAGSTAIKAFQTCIPDGFAYWRMNEKIENFCRTAYYGGVVFPGHYIGNWGSTASIDINAAYAYQMSNNKYPVGTPCYTTKYIPGKLGIYQVYCTVPEQLFGELGFNPIPLRTKYGLTWPTGSFETTITSVEIEYARSVGCSITVLFGYIWLREEGPFKEFIEKCQKLEIEDNGKYKPAIKLLRNSCYGKFGTKPSHAELIFDFNGIPDLPVGPILSERGKPIDGVYTLSTKTDANYIHPHWAAFITAYQRIYLFRYVELMYKLGAKNVYCDTDSIKCDASVILLALKNEQLPIGSLYGQFKFEGIYTEFIVLGAKTYYGEKDKDYIKKGEEPFEAKAKGLRNSVLTKEIYYDRINDNAKQQEFDSVRAIKDIIKKGGLPYVKRKRTISNIRNSRSWRTDEVGNIMPISVSM